MTSKYEKTILQIVDTVGRVDERTQKIFETQAEQSRHLAMINGSLQKHQDNLMAINTTVYGKNSDKGLCGDVSTLRKTMYWLVALIITGGTISGLEIGDVIHLFGG